MSRPLVIVGAGGHGREAHAVALAIGDWNPISFVDDAEIDANCLARIDGWVQGTLDTLVREPADHVIAIGDPGVRRRAALRLGDRLGATVLVDPSAWIGSDVELAPGAMVFPASICTTNVRVGHHSHVNSGVIVSHDCRIGDFVSLSPGVMLNGGVVVEDDAFLGTGAIVLPGCRVGQGATIGAGSVVRDDVEANTTVVGVPAQRVDRDIRVIAT